MNIKTTVRRKPRRKSHGVFGAKRNGHKTPRKKMGSFDLVKILQSNIRDIDLIMRNNPSMDGLNILKQDMLDMLNFKENNKFLNNNNK